MAHDYSEFITERSVDKLELLSELATEQLRLETKLEEAQAAVEVAAKELQDIAERAIPELMLDLGMESFRTSSGIKVDVGEKVRASIIAAQHANAMAWLRDEGHAGLIKRKLELSFGMGEDKMAKKALDLLEDYEVGDKADVHWSTLGKFVREMLAEGKEVPDTLFSVHKQRISKVKVS